jgi:hypothetical protein
VTRWIRMLALLVVLVVPLGLAVASQVLAARPGPPSVPVAPVQLPGSGAAPVAPAPPPAAAPPAAAPPAAAPPAAAPPAAAPPAAAPPADPRAPRVVAPAPPGLEQDDDDDDDDDTDFDTDVDDD